MFRILNIIQMRWVAAVMLGLLVVNPVKAEVSVTRVGEYAFEVGTELVPTSPGHYQERKFMRVRLKHKVVLQRHDDATYWVKDLRQPMDDDGPYRPSGLKPRLVDFTGDGVPEVVVQRWNGGAHGAYEYEVFTVVPQLRSLWRVNAVYGHFDFREIPGSLPQIILEDTTFAYWNCGYADAPRMKVIYRWNGRGFAFDRRAMKEAPDYEGAVKSVRVQGGFSPNREAPLYDRWPVGPSLAPTLLRFIYGGRADLAWRLLDEVWPDAATRKQFRGDFLRQLGKSPHLGELRRFNPAGSLEGT